MDNYILTQNILKNRGKNGFKVCKTPEGIAVARKKTCSKIEDTFRRSEHRPFGHFSIIRFGFGRYSSFTKATTLYPDGIRSRDP
jgi:hypothetical protein